MIQKLIIELQRILDRSCIAGRIKSKDPARPWSSPPGGLGAVGDGEASENDDLGQGEAAETKGLGDGGAVEDDDVTAEEDVDVAAVFIIMLCFIYCFYLT